VSPLAAVLGALGDCPAETVERWLAAAARERFRVHVEPADSGGLGVCVRAYFRDGARGWLFPLRCADAAEAAEVLATAGLAPPDVLDPPPWRRWSAPPCAWCGAAGGRAHRAACPDVDSPTPPAPAEGATLPATVAELAAWCSAWRPGDPRADLRAVSGAGAVSEAEALARSEFGAAEVRWSVATGAELCRRHGAVALEGSPDVRDPLALEFARSTGFGRRGFVRDGTATPARRAMTALHASGIHLTGRAGRVVFLTVESWLVGGRSGVD